MADRLDFTIRSIEAIPAPAAGRLELKDTKTPGLYLRVTSNGVKSFSFVGRAKGSNRVERVTLGKFPTVKPEQARSRATQIGGQLASGKSVATVERERRGELTLNDLRDLYVKHLEKTTKRPQAFEDVYRLYTEPVFGTRRLSEIRATDVENWLHAVPEKMLRRRAEKAAHRQAVATEKRNAIAARQEVRRHGPDPKASKLTRPPANEITGERTANSALEGLRAIFNWAIKPRNAFFVGVNPASGHKLFPKKERDRFLQPAELKPFFASLAVEPNTTARDCIVMKLLTGARKANVHQMRWAEVDLNKMEWRIPKTKNGDSQNVPLVPEAVAILELRKESATTAFVFPSVGKNGYIHTTARAWRRVLERAELTNIIEHDLRRTLGSWQARTGASLVLIGKSLNHRDATSTQIYARLDTDPVRQSVTRATTAMFEAAGLKAPTPVVQLQQKSKRGRRAA